MSDPRAYKEAVQVLFQRHLSKENDIGGMNNDIDISGGDFNDES